MWFMELLKAFLEPWLFWDKSSPSYHSRKGLLNKPKNKIPYSYYERDILKGLEKDEDEKK